MAMTNQGARQAAYRVIGGTAGTYNEDAMAAYLTLATPGGTFNEAELEYLMTVTGNDDPTLSGQRVAYAGDLGFDSWNSLNTFVG